jgi:hypothetical protein
LCSKTTFISAWACEQLHPQPFVELGAVTAVVPTTAFISVWARQQTSTAVCRVRICFLLLLLQHNLSKDKEATATAFVRFNISVDMQEATRNGEWSRKLLL